MKKYNLYGVIILFFVALFIGQARAEEEAESPAVLERTAVISAKEMTRASGYVTIDGAHFRVNKETVIIGLRGTNISLNSLMVPCRARIIFVPDHTAPLLKEIRVLRHLTGASADFLPY